MHGPGAIGIHRIGTVLVRIECSLTTTWGAIGVEEVRPREASGSIERLKRDSIDYDRSSKGIQNRRGLTCIQDAK